MIELMHWKVCCENIRVYTFPLQREQTEKKVWPKTFPFELLKLQLIGSVVAVRFLENYLKRKVDGKSSRQKEMCLCVGMIKT